MKNPLLIEDVEFIENNMECFQEHIGNGFNHYMSEWLSDYIRFNFWAFFLLLSGWDIEDCTSMLSFI